MSTETRLNDLLSLWQEKQARGEDVDAAKLCRECPELLPEVECRLRALRQMQRLAEAAVPARRAEPPAPPPSDPEAETHPPQPDASEPDALCQPAFTDYPATIVPDAAQETTSRPWPTVPGYEIVGELGRGGMGVVYKARQTRLNRLVALKMILAGGHAGAADRARFRTEAEAIARLQHPHIVQVHEVGEHVGKPFFSLEFCPGGNLDRKLNGTPVSPQVAASLVETLARAMHAAHQANVIHRDLKPANVLLAADGSPKITDFGLAKKLDEEGQTQSGAIMGTPSYMAPEQAGGKTREVGPATDVYALGAILYELLTGRPPFKAATPLDTLLQVVAADPVPPTQLQSKMPRDLETICLKCLQKVPGKRYASAEELVEELRRFQAGEPIRARPVGRLERGWRWCRRNPAVASLLVAVALALVGGTTVSWRLALKAGGEKNQALREKAKAEQHLVTAHLLRVGLVFENDPDEALVLLRDQQAIPVGLRDAAWGFYARYCRRKVRTLQGTMGSVRSVAFSPDGKTLATGSGSRFNVPGEVTLWDLVTGQERASFKGHTEGVYGVAISPDGKTLAAATSEYIQGDDHWKGVVMLWDVATGQQRASLKGHFHQVLSVGFSPDGRSLASGSGAWRLPGSTPPLEPGELKLWDVATGQERACFKGHTGTVTSVAFSPDGKTLASVANRNIEPGQLKLWDVATGQERAPLSGPTDDITAVAFSPDGKMLAIGGGAFTPVKLWDLAKGQERVSLLGRFEDIDAMAFSPDGKMLALARGDGRVTLWDVTTDQERTSFKPQTSGTTCMAFSPDGTALASVGDGVLKLRPMAMSQERALLKGHKNTVRSMAFSRDSKTLASGSEDRTVKLWDVATGQERASLTGQFGQVESVAFSPNDRILASGSRDGTVKLWDVATGQERASLEGVGISFISMAFSGDGKMLATGSTKGTVKLWDVATGQERAPFHALNKDETCVAFSPDGKTLVSVHDDVRLLGAVRLLDVATGQVLASFKGGSYVVAFSPDGKMLAFGGNLWDVATGQLRATLQAKVSVSSVAISADGKTLASGNGDGTVKLWDVVTGQERASLKGHTKGVMSVAFSPDGKTLASAGLDQTVRLWDVATEQ